MTAQEIYDTVLAHLRKQGRASRTIAGGCRYRGPDGTACAVGCLIPDELYDHRIEGLSVVEIMGGETHTASPSVRYKFRETLARITRRLGAEHLQLLENLQRAHDQLLADGGLARWEREMEDIARHFKLEYTPTDPQPRTNSTHKLQERSMRQNYELVAAMWPLESNVIGDGWANYGGGSYTAAVQLRAILPDNVYTEAPETRAAGNLCLYLHAYRGAVSVELVTQSIHHMNLRNAEALAKEMKRLQGKLSKSGLGNSVRNTTPRREMELAFRALGIQRAVQYAPRMEREFVSAAVYLDAFAATSAKRADEVGAGDQS